MTPKKVLNCSLGSVSKMHAKCRKSKIFALPGERGFLARYRELKIEVAVNKTVALYGEPNTALSMKVVAVLPPEVLLS